MKLIPAERGAEYSCSGKQNEANVNLYYQWRLLNIYIFCLRHAVTHETQLEYN